MPSLRTQRKRRDVAKSAREVGFAAGVGLEVEVEPPVATDTGSVCSHCGTVGRLDMVDATVQRAFLTCPSCGRTWDTDRLDGIAAD